MSLEKAEEVRGSLKHLKDNAFKLYRPVMGDGKSAMFERLRCQCGCNELEIDLTTDGWCVECPECGEASMVSDLFNGKWSKKEPK